MPPNYAWCGIFLGGIFYAFGILPNQYSVNHVEELDMILPLGFRSPGQARTVSPNSFAQWDGDHFPDEQYGA